MPMEGLSHWSSKAKICALAFPNMKWDSTEKHRGYLKSLIIDHENRLNLYPKHKNTHIIEIFKPDTLTSLCAKNVTNPYFVKKKFCSKFQLLHNLIIFPHIMWIIYLIMRNSGSIAYMWGFHSVEKREKKSDWGRKKGSGSWNAMSLNALWDLVISYGTILRAQIN